MFCYNCGNTIVEGTRFCSNCGVKLEQFDTSDINTQNRTGNLQMMIQEEDDELSNEEIAEIAFKTIFNTPRMFGKQIIIIGKEPINQLMKKNLNTYYLDKGEKALLIFNYENNMERGFVISNRRIVWFFDSIKGQNQMPLLDIKKIELGKSVLATIMKLISYDNVESSKIYLTGIRNELEFVSKLQEYIDEINSYYEDTNEETEIYVPNNKPIKDEKITKKYEVETKTEVLENLITPIFKNISIDSMYCEIGYPIITNQSKKIKNARINFKIPSNENIYLIYDSTILGGCTKGFAICTSGIYYSENQTGYIDWDTIKNINITKGITGLKIGNALFNVGIGTDGKNLLMILKILQENM